jgi:hypothetical protein
LEIHGAVVAGNFGQYQQRNEISRVEVVFKDSLETLQTRNSQISSKKKLAFL